MKVAKPCPTTPSLSSLALFYIVTNNVTGKSLTYRTPIRPPRRESCLPPLARSAHSAPSLRHPVHGGLVSTHIRPSTIPSSCQIDAVCHQHSTSNVAKSYLGFTNTQTRKLGRIEQLNQV
jgi:hypothetical protein